MDRYFPHEQLEVYEVAIAEDAGTKLACYLDMVEVTSHVRFESAKKHVRDVMAMLSGMHRHLRDC